ncbi:MAG: sigma-70 family RNA polymerase sigma factor [Archangium sp.]|nr:sigma-70 family RNA polymerase sigma factor [Archangium sp.]
MSPSDEQLLAAARAGDGRAMEQLLARHEPSVYRFGLRMCGNEDDAREVLQETLLATFKNLASFRGDSKLSTWLYQVARSFCTKQRRRHEGEPAEHAALEDVEARRVVSDSTGPDARTHARQVGEVIQAALATLPIEQREAIVLRDVEGLSTEEAADVVGIEVYALKSRLHRARMSLKQSLAAVLDDDGTELGCEGLRQELSSYAASEIDQAACAHIEEHLQTCAQCSAACESLKRTVSMCRSIPGGEVPVTVRTAVRRALLRH